MVAIQQYVCVFYIPAGAAAGSTGVAAAGSTTTGATGAAGSTGIAATGAIFVRYTESSLSS